MASSQEFTPLAISTLLISVDFISVTTCHFINFIKNVIDFFRARYMFHAPDYTTFLRLSKRPKSSSGKVHIPATIRMIIKFSCAVLDIYQLVFLPSIPKMQNLECNISGFDLEVSL